jgi:hypothetical protein
MSRKTHLVGAWPGRGPEHAMEVALTNLGPHLNSMSDGETGDRALWVTASMDALRANPDLETVHDGGWTDYNDLAQWKIKDGQKMSAGNVRLPYARAFDASFTPFKELRERFGRPDLRFQVGIPLPGDIALYSFGEGIFVDPEPVEAFTEATLREIREIAEIGGDDVVFQLETCLALVAVAQAPDEEQAAVATQMAKYLTDIAAGSPEGTRFGIHICLGDFHHKAIATMRDIRPVVLVANAVVEGWPQGRILEFVHAPFAAANEPPVEGDAFYAPLADLALPEDTRFIAGFIHESLELDAHRELLDRIEGLLGRQVDIAAACGLGRRPSEDEAWDAMQKSVALIEATS